MEIEELARKYAIQNAVKFNGKASIKAVVGKIMAEREELREKVREAFSIVEMIVKEINQIPLEKQKSLLKSYPIEKKEGKRRILPPLPNVEGMVVTRFPPEPNGYLHIGHAKAAIIDHEYAKMYDGKFILRFDDTNPEKEKKKFYDTQKEDLRWLGVEWDKEYRTSDNLLKHYELAEKLIKKGKAYVCLCDAKKIKKNRRECIECDCRRLSPKEQMERWGKMHSGKRGKGKGKEKGILRLKGKMDSANTAMRDPTLFRIVDAIHPIHPDYRVWPTYDFAGAVEDSLSGVTHPFRTKEYELRDEVYFYLLDCLDLRKPNLMEFARLSIEGMPVSKRKIKSLIDEEMVMGWEDPRIPTLRGLEKRGISPLVIKKFVLSQGISRAESVIKFDLIQAMNRKVMDPIARRFFFIPDPVELLVENASEKEVALKYHPTEKLGERKIKTHKKFFIPSEDAKRIKIGEVFRLKDLFNVRVLEKNDSIKGEFAGDELIATTKKIQWVADRYMEIKILIPDVLFIRGEYNEKSLRSIKGYVEENIKSATNGEVVQFERFGFVRIEKNGKIRGILAHK